MKPWLTQCRATIRWLILRCRFREAVTARTKSNQKNINISIQKSCQTRIEDRESEEGEEQETKKLGQRKWAHAITTGTDTRDTWPCPSTPMTDAINACINWIYISLQLKKKEKAQKRQKKRKKKIIITIIMDKRKMADATADCNLNHQLPNHFQLKWTVWIPFNFTQLATVRLTAGEIDEDAFDWPLPATLPWQRPPNGRYGNGSFNPAKAIAIRPAIPFTWNFLMVFPSIPSENPIGESHRRINSSWISPSDGALLLPSIHLSIHRSIR